MQTNCNIVQFPPTWEHERFVKRKKKLAWGLMSRILVLINPENAEGRLQFSQETFEEVYEALGEVCCMIENAEPEVRGER